MAWHIRKAPSEKDSALEEGVLERLSWKDI
jgi:hypothetical protein